MANYFCMWNSSFKLFYANLELFFFTHPVSCYVAVVLLIFLENVQKSIQYKDVTILLFERFLKFVNEISTQGCKGTRDVISSDLPFFEWHVQHTFTRQENAGIFKSSIRLRYTRYHLESDKGVHVTIRNQIKVYTLPFGIR